MMFWLAGSESERRLVITASWNGALKNDFISTMEHKIVSIIIQKHTSI
jgi:hypothetical protein